MLSTEAVSAAVREARKPKQIEAGGISRAATIVSKIPGAERLPRALLILLENAVRRAKTDEEAMLMCARILEAGEKGAQGKEIEFMPSRVLFQDFTGVPVFVDFAAMRDAMAARGGDPEKVNPHIPTTLIIDHSVIAEEAGCAGARAENERIEAERNRERFAFLKWASRSFENVKVVPPAEGICHQLNMERFSKVVGTDALWQGEKEMACFDTLVGTDSHTTTVNGIGCMGWGVGGIEAEAAALGQSITMLVPEVVELRLEGKLRDGISGMDCALTVCELLRKAQVVGSLVEVTGPGVAELTATQRACIANMTPEYGATTTLFPVDAQTFKYLALTGRDPEEIAFIEAYLREQGMLGERDAHYARAYTLDLSTVEPCLAGPSRPPSPRCSSGAQGPLRGVVCRAWPQARDGEDGAPVRRQDVRARPWRACDRCHHELHDGNRSCHDGGSRPCREESHGLRP
jgi:aconitate hydratase